MNQCMHAGLTACMARPTHACMHEWGNAYMDARINDYLAARSWRYAGSRGQNSSRSPPGPHRWLHSQSQAWRPTPHACSSLLAYKTKKMNETRRRSRRCRKWWQALLQSCWCIYRFDSLRLKSAVEVHAFPSKLPTPEWYLWVSSLAWLVKGVVCLSCRSDACIQGRQLFWTHASIHQYRSPIAKRPLGP